MDTSQVRERVRLNVEFNTIQMIRLVGALLEADFDFDFPTESKDVLEHLSRYFNIKYSINTNNLPVITDVSIQHKEKPICKVGTLERPLVYPQEMLKKCKAKWQDNRGVKFSFTGLMTSKRKNCLDEWITRHYSKQNVNTNKIRVFRKSRKGRLFNILLSVFRRADRKVVFENIGLHIFTSNQGRQFPIKVWDEEYYDTLLKSQFVLCPDGDFTWTYRFFEAIICGAIPVVENSCDLYTGFEFFSMKDPVEKLVYSAKVAESNFQILRDKFTFKRDELNEQIASLISASA